MNAKLRLPLQSAGFTLIELMIVVVIVAILAAVAVPSYQDSVRKGHRADAQQFMLNLAQLNQQYFLDSRSYTNSITTLVSTGTPASVSQYYGLLIAVNPGPPASYMITAAPTGSQASDSCGTLTLTSANIKSSSAGSNCW